MAKDPKKHLVDNKYTLRELVDLKKLRGIFQHFSDAMGFTVGFLSVPDMEILIATGWREICTKFHRRCPLAAENCRRSNARLIRQMTKPGKIVIKACANGLVDCAMPIFVKGKCVAILATGQVLLEVPSIPRFRKQAKIFGCNEKKYLAALAGVPVISAKRLKQMAGFLKELASLVVELGYAGLKEKEKAEELARDIATRKKTENILKETAGQLQSLYDSVTDGVLVADARTRKILKVNASACRIFGYSEREFLEKKADDLYPPEDAKKNATLFRDQLRKKKTFGTGIPFRNKGGSIFFTDVAAQPIELQGKRCLVGFFRDSTERNRAEERLRKSLSLERAMLESTADGILVIEHSTGKITDFNEKFAQLWNMPGKLLQRRDDAKLLKYVLPQLKDSKQFLSKVKELYCHPRKDSFDVLRLKDGRVIERYSHPQLVNGKPVGCVWSFRDVTARERTEAILRSSEERFRRFATASGYGFAMGELSGRLVFGNAATLRIVGEKREKDFTRKTFFQYYRPQDAKRLKKEILPIVIKQGRWTGELPLLSAKGNLIITEQNIFLIRDEQGKPRMVGNVITDITDRKQAEEALREHRRQLLQIIDAVPHMIFAKDQKGRFLLVNRAVAKAYRREPKDLIGVRCQDIQKNRQEVEVFLKGDREVLATGKPVLISNESFTEALGRKHLFQAIKMPLKMAGIKEPCILGVKVDVTEQRKVEEFRNEIVRTVSHELRTPLSIEKEGISILMDGLLGPVNAEQKELLGTVMRSIDRLSRMITSLLDISSIETGKIKLSHKMTNLADLVRDAVFEFKKRADEKGVELSVKLPERAISFLADPDKITQVLTNLVDNAVKFTEKGSVEISAAVLKGRVKCEVRDTGIGIAPRNVEKLFEKFQQFSRTAGPGEKGFGLGLSIAKGIIELHGGRIWIQSKFGKGTRAMFSLPIGNPGALESAAKGDGVSPNLRQSVF